MKSLIVDTILKKNVNCDQSLKNFVKQFYAHFSDEYQDKTEILFQIAKSLYDFVQTRKKNENKVRIFKPTIKNHGWESSLTVIEVVTEDKPFLVDSATEELKSKGYIIYDRINSVIMRNIGNEEIMESVIYFSVTDMTEKKMSELKSELIKILQMIECCVADWKAMLTKVDLAANITASNNNIAKKDNEEIVAFLYWLKKDNFIFLGYAEYSWEVDGDNIVRDNNSSLGIPKIDTAIYDIEVSKEAKSAIYITRSDRISKVHRRVNMDCIGVRRYNKKGEIIGEVRFLGLFTSIVYYQDVKLIPIIRKKIAVVEGWSKFLKGSHNHKVLITVLQDFPRAELLHIPEKELFASCMGILSLSIREEVKLFVHIDEVGKFVRCIIFVPKNQFSTALWLKMQKLIANTFHAKVVNEQMRDSGLVRLQLILKIESIKHVVDAKKLELKLKEMARDWKEHVKCALENEFGIGNADSLYRIYENAFPVSYQEAFTADATLYDIKRIEKVRIKKEVESDLHCDGTDNYQLKIYVPKKIIGLFDMLPVIENMGMKITNHYSYVINVVKNCEILIHHFLVSINMQKKISLTLVKEKFELALSKIWKKEVENDYYNSLVLAVGSDWREVLLFRAFSHYLKQIRFHYTEVFIQQALFNHTKIVSLLTKLFHTRLDPKLFSNNTVRNEEVEKISVQLEQLIGEIDNLAEDKIIRALVEIIMSIIRTNYYYSKQYLSFKIDSRKIQNLPLPKPFVEIYVYSHKFEAIHLRGGKVARGGIRWSDRTEDFRTEILGLMKAQMPKNTVIVPVGSKGGFIVKCNGKDYDNVVNCYKDFLRAMLDITDNIVGESVKRPKNTVIYDEDDPYLVLAADKGTATFSDYANAVAKEYNFWLGDAFASGGSTGYDHKAMSITSRGAWVAAQNHLWVLGYDNKKELKMVGIGDMSGDVFGNGLLLSKKIKLIMAFNHIHIFIDPNPDVLSSFNERKRLFNLKRSTWTDYNKELISAGGGIFSRNSKLIRISEQMKKVFDISEDKLDPDALIRKGLQAKVDIIWNGGIGTFIKSSRENNDVVGDKSNDAIRINGKEVRAKMIIEGGNLGCTQLGRIEYAKGGSFINTDFIDNSAGVTCSDMEVNIKIALSKAVLNKKITIKERNELMEEMQDEVTKIILHNTNFLQARSLVIVKMEATDRLEQYHRLVKHLEKEKRLNRAVEFIPNDEEFLRMYSEKNNLSVPEIAVIIAYAKMSIYDQLISSELPDDKYLIKYLVEYFPHGMRKKFYDEIMEHRLRREIITTQVVNSVVNRMGCTFIFSLVEYTGASIAKIVKIYILVYYAYRLDAIWEMVDNLKTKIDVTLYLEIVNDINKFIKDVVHWFIRNYPKSINIQLAITEFKDNIIIIADNICRILDKKSCDLYNHKLTKLTKLGLSDNLSKQIASLQFLSSALPIIQVTNNIRFYGKIQIPLLVIANLYFKIGFHLDFIWLREATVKLERGDYWHRLSIEVLFDDLQDQQMKLTEQIAKEINDVENCDEAIKYWLEFHKDLLQQYNIMLNDLKVLKELDLSRLIIIIKSLAKIN
ncbi:MAG: NAD-glutamate dehydrogenase [Rickettsiaceae bacterium H1]|nr:NAD-glutamate dehydrogenase [Rickettsiaceae bacterium H1]